MRKYAYTLIVLLIIFLTQQVYTFTNQPPLGYTNAPGESNCTGCHSGTAISSGTTWSGMNLTTSVPLSAMQPNTTYLMNLTFADPMSVKYGFQLVALPGNAVSSSASIGTITLNSGNTSVNISTQSGRTYARTTSSGTQASNNTRTWSFNYTTPSTAANGVRFYAVVNSTNNSNDMGGDDIYVKSFIASVLPVKWLDVVPVIKDNQIELIWSTATELNNSHFDIETSTNAIDWDIKGTVKGGGNKNTISNYSFMLNAENALYARIKQTDFDGTFSYSKVVNLPIAGNEEIFLVQQKNRELYFNNKITTAQVFGINGRCVKQITEPMQYIYLHDLPGGIYFLQIKSENNTVVIKKVFIN